MKYIKGFDGLRAYSIILVILSHLGLYGYLPENKFAKERIWLLINGETGVLVFFNLSGFLITLILLNEKLKKGRINFKHFFIKRFLRLLPPFILLLISLIILSQLKILDIPSEAFVLSFFYLYNFAPEHLYFGEIGHTWSLAVEEQFYLLWPFIIKYLNKIKVIFIIIGIVIASLTFLYLIKLGYLSTYRRPDRWFIPACSSILLGALISISIFTNHTKTVDFLKKRKALYIGITLYLFPLYSLKYILFSSPLFMGFGISLIMGWIYLNQNTSFTRFLNLKILVYIGKISYGLYVYQGIFLRTGPGSNLYFQQFPQNLIFTVIITILSFEFLEKPILKLKSKLS